MTFAQYEESAAHIRARYPQKSAIGLVLGSSLGPLAEGIENRVEIAYEEIPHFLRATVASHAGKLILGELCGKRVACLSGRFHYYEGYGFEQLALPVRVLKLLGVEKLILTNAAGAVNEGYRVGDIMVVRDHIKLMGASPMRGENLEGFGPRFFDVSEAYDPALRALALGCAARLGQGGTTREGIYFYMPGPQFETPAEIRAIRLLGGDAVGMSTVTEALTAAHCGVRVLALSLMTNMAAGILPQKLSDEEVGLAARAAAGRFQELLREIVKEM